MRINRVVTRTGDDGKTALIGGDRVAKSALRVNSYGEVDELNSWLGLAAGWIEDDQINLILENIQHPFYSR